MNFFGSQPQPTLPINPRASPPWLFPLTQQQFLLSAFHRLQLFFFFLGFGVIETSLFFFFFALTVSGRIYHSAVRRLQLSPHP